MTLEARLIDGSGPTEEQFTYTNASGSSRSITDHEVFAIKDGAGKRIAAVLWASTQGCVNLSSGSCHPSRDSN